MEEEEGEGEGEKKKKERRGRGMKSTYCTNIQRNRRRFAPDGDLSITKSDFQSPWINFQDLSGFVED